MTPSCPWQRGQGIGYKEAMEAMDALLAAVTKAEGATARGVSLASKAARKDAE